MRLKEITTQFNILTQCRKYGISLWQSPQFLFLVMGIINIGSIIISYVLGNRFIEDPQIVVLITTFLATTLFIIAFIITRSFEKLIEIARMKSEFINIVSHQLRSPLTNLKWTIELLFSGRVDHIGTQHLEYFKNLKENTTRMTELVNDLVIVSRIESATLPLKKNEFSLTDLIREIVSKFKIFAEASNAEIKFLPQQELPKILTDPSQIRLVIENLLDNAIRYIKGKGEVTIRLERKKGILYFEIQDNGVGIPKEEQKYIFQKFFRAENISRYQTQGSGLGLYIAKSILERSGGKIGFKSEEGKGSTFWFTLPIKKD